MTERPTNAWIAMDLVPQEILLDMTAMTAFIAKTEEAVKRKYRSFGYQRDRTKTIQRDISDDGDQTWLRVVIPVKLREEKENV